MLGEGRSER